MSTQDIDNKLKELSILTSNDNNNLKDKNDFDSNDQLSKNSSVVDLKDNLSDKDDVFHRLYKGKE